MAPADDASDESVALSLIGSQASDGTSVDLEISGLPDTLVDDAVSDDGLVDLELPEPFKSASCVGPQLVDGEIVAGLDEAFVDGGFRALAAAWNSTQHQVGNHVVFGRGGRVGRGGQVGRGGRGDVGGREGRMTVQPGTTSLQSMLQLAFAKKQPSRIRMT